MSFEFTLALSIILFLCLIEFFALIGKKKSTTYSPADDYATIMAILNKTIEDEIRYKEHDYEVREVKIIYDFEADVRELTKNIMVSFSREFLQQLEFYHTRDYIILFVNRRVQKFLIEWTQRNKPKTR